MNNYKLGSLFDGSGGFPLAGTLCGIEPVWAAEIEPYPIAVTRSRFPNMKHLGDISKVNGAEIEPVDIITFGSPCQDLSVAGKRAGLKHEVNGDEETTRSGLFMEAVRIIKEMRNATNGQYPTFALWENVPGAFSSNKGEDFRIVCEELIKIVEPTATMPSVPQKGWNYADSFIGDGWSLAYRVLDAQYWGVPQRRRRIYLVADFRGERAREVLFEREGLRGYFTQGRTPWQTTPADAQGGSHANDREGEGFDRYNQCLTGNISATLRVPDGGDNCACVIERGNRGLDDVAYTLKIRSGCEGGGKGALVQKDKSATLACNNDQTLFQPKPKKEVIAIDKESYCSGSGFDRKPGITVGGPCATLQAQGVPHAVCYEAKPQMFENHSQDTRYKGPLDIAQTVSATYGMGGNNQPFVVEPTPFCKSARGKFKGDAETWKDGKVANTLNTFDQGETRANELVVQEAPVICLQGNGIDRADTAGCNGKGWKEDTAYTLNTIDRPAVAYGLDRASFNQGQNAKFDFTVTEDSQPTLTARGPGTVAQQVYHSSKASFFMRASEDGTADTLVATDYKDPQLIAYNESIHRYIVRRLTPTECARLQGFADWHGHLEEKTFLTDAEFKFWTDVRNTHAAINGKKVQEYTRKQMLTWYNKLWTDSAEYKMWGNGIALPTALYVVQGIADALDAAEMIMDELNGATELVEDWML
jgi:DNA (cytosine-5)-methyltransferase 1